MKIFKYFFLSLIFINSDINAAATSVHQWQSEQTAQVFLTRLLDVLKKDSRHNFLLTDLSGEFRSELFDIEEAQRVEIEEIFALKLDKLLHENPIDYTDFYNISKDGIMAYRFLEFKHYEFDRLLKLTEDKIRKTDSELYEKIDKRLWSDQIVRAMSDIHIGNRLLAEVDKFSVRILLPCTLFSNAQRIELMTEFIIGLNEKIKAFDCASR